GGAKARALRMWLIFTASTFLIWLLVRVAAYPFRLSVAVLLSAVLAGLFFGPAIRGWGFRARRSGLCQAGVLGMAAYILGCAMAPQAAIVWVEAFVEETPLTADRIAALPIPPSLLDWGDAVRTPDGLYEAQFDLRDNHPPTFWWVPDSPPDAFIARAWD